MWPRIANVGQIGVPSSYKIVKNIYIKINSRYNICGLVLLRCMED
jgi:hypothetical protein